MQIDNVPGNGETQPKPAKLPGDGRISLFEWLKKRLDFSGINTNPAVADLKKKARPRGIRRADVDFAAARREFDGIVNYVPKNLLDPDRIGPNKLFFRGELRRHFQSFGNDIGMGDLERITHQGMG